MRLFEKLIRLAATLVMSAGPSIVSAEENDCLPLLQPDIVDLSHNLQVNLALLDRMSETAKEGDRTKIGASYGDAGFDFGSSRDVSSTLKKLLKIDYSREERDNIYLSTLSEEDRRTYVDCIHGKKQEIAYTFVGDIVNESVFFLTIQWTPIDRPSLATAKMLVKVTQGKIQEGNSKQYETDIFDRKSALLTIERDPFQNQQIAIVIDNKVKVINIPARSRFEVGKGLVDSTMGGRSLAVKTAENRGDVGGDVCVKLPDEVQDKALIPGTFRVVYAKKRAIGVTLSEGPLVGQDRQVCKYIGVVFNTPFKSYADVDATAVMDVFIATPSK
ncbi:hypothetical protein EOD23_30765 [Mesorhizobium sp. USDA-HM6]|nr:hypothetical protein EOD23_30765 [Mesorhizobium sp. USDA-HM6]